ncbi:MAG: histidine kinase [Rubrobacter sp.]|nr:histidine kinase [Rubrobacter sp.]
MSAARFARFLFAISMTLVALAGVFLFLNWPDGSPYFVNLTATALAFSLVGVLVASRRPENPVGWLFCAVGLLYAVTVFSGEYGAFALDAGLPGGTLAFWFASWLWLLGANVVLFSFLFFPDGRLPSSRWRPAAWLFIAVAFLSAAVWAFAPDVLWRAFSDDLPPFGNLFGFESAAWILIPANAALAPLSGVVCILAPLAALVARFRRATGEERRQIKWVAYAAAILMTAVVSVSFWPALDGSWFGMALFLAGFLGIPASVGVAILKHRLFDIDLIINRTLVYGALTACVVGIYAFVVGYLSVLFQTGGNLLFSLVATGAVAALFAPLRERLQRLVNRLIYGARDDPYAVVSRLGERLEATLAPDAVLPAIVGTIRDALKLPYTAIELPREDGFETAATAGEPSTEPLRLPLSYQGETVGRLLLGPRSPNEDFSATDRKLMDDLAHHAGVAVHGVRVMTDLQRSREKLVLAREEERRRLRRDLHDELAPTLAALGLTAATVGELIEADPKRAASVNDKLRMEIRNTVGEVRRLVYDLRPPALDELGLAEAIRERAARYGGFRVTVEVSNLPSNLPAAVEVAAYRIVQEALMNVARHAEARKCAVRMSCPEERFLDIEVVDDGVGMPASPKPGIGLSSMRERAAELGGGCEIGNVSSGGVRIFVRLPLPEEPSENKAPKSDA